MGGNPVEVAQPLAADRSPTLRIARRQVWQVEPRYVGQGGQDCVAPIGNQVKIVGQRFKDRLNFSNYDSIQKRGQGLRIGRDGWPARDNQGMRLVPFGGAEGDTGSPEEGHHVEIVHLVRNGKGDDGKVVERRG